jgi:predicted nucleic acid-binding protein
MELRKGDAGILGTRNVAFGSALWLSAVVLEELYAGADVKGRKVLSKFESDFSKVGRLLVPQASDWSKAGTILARIGERFGYDRIGKSRLTNDALIATSAARKGMVLITRNHRDFRLLATYCSLDFRTM